MNRSNRGWTAQIGEPWPGLTGQAEIGKNKKKKEHCAIFFVELCLFYLSSSPQI